jgi:hypothetical protein
MVDEIIRLASALTPEVVNLRRGVVLTGAAEQMFFFNAPLAHVVAFEQWQRSERLRQTYARQARMTRRAALQPPPVFRVEERA